MDWAKNGKGNRNPKLVLDGDSGISVLTKSVDPGASVTLDASGTTDPDGDQLKFHWFVQDDAGSYRGKVAIVGSDSSKVALKVPSDAAGRSFHLICQVTDNGTHNLSSYRRVVFEATGESTDTPDFEQLAKADSSKSQSKSNKSSKKSKKSKSAASSTGRRSGNETNADPSENAPTKSGELKEPDEELADDNKAGNNTGRRGKDVTLDPRRFREEPWFAKLPCRILDSGAEMEARCDEVQQRKQECRCRVGVSSC